MQILRNHFKTQPMFYLFHALMWCAVFFRTLIIYWGHADLGRALGLLFTWAGLLISLPVISPFLPRYFPFYLLLQTSLIISLLRLPVFPDYFSVLFSMLSVQIIEKYSLKISAGLIALFTPITIPLLIPSLGVGQALALGVFYMGVNILMASFEHTVLRAQHAREQNQALMQALAASNQQLQAFAHRVEGLAVTRERSELARELHDSVTQTVFSMTLTTKSALMLLERDVSRVGGQIDRLNQLAQSAQAEMRLLIAELGTEKFQHEDLKTVLQRHLQIRPLPESLQITMEVQGTGLLTAEENRHLFRIVQEALNNTIKHAQATSAVIRLHLEPPFWAEFEDNGLGFDPQKAWHTPPPDGQQIGLRSMQERAAAIHWAFTLHAAPGTPTRIHLKKLDCLPHEHHP